MSNMDGARGCQGWNEYLRKAVEGKAEGRSCAPLVKVTQCSHPLCISAVISLKSGIFFGV